MSEPIQDNSTFNEDPIPKSYKTHDLKKGDWVIVKKGVYWSIKNQKNCLFKKQVGQISATTYLDNACFVQLQGDEVTTSSYDLIYFYDNE